MKKVVLAYSGGLDTSCCIPWLKEQGYEVIAFAADLGQGSDLADLKKRAIRSGASKIYIKDLKQEFIDEYVIPLLKANAVYESKYPLATALGRPLIAKHLVKIARKEKVKAVAHGCTGKGNDQVRIEVAVNTLAPELEIVAPLREWDLGSRESEINYAKKHGIPVKTTKKSPYSLDKNLWGVSIECGALEDPWEEPRKDVYQMTVDPGKAPAKAHYLTLDFKKGVPVKIDSHETNLAAIISTLNRIGGRHGVGRFDMVENRLIGIKSREIYEAPAAAILLAAHKALEDLILDRELSHFKQMISQKYAELVYYGLWFSPLKKALDGFIEVTQKNITGTVRLKLYKGMCTVCGRKSRYSLYNKKLATYGEGDTFDRSAAEGFIKLWGLPYKQQK